MNDIIGDDIVCSVRGAVRHILQLAADPDAQESLFAVDGLVDNLLEYLKFNDEDVRLAAARSFRFLSSNPNIKPKLKAMSAVTTTMLDISMNEEGPLRQAAADYLDNVIRYRGKAKNGNINDVISEVDAKIEEYTTPKAYRYEMMGLNDDELRNRLQETIIGITGVLSITFDKPRNLIIVFIRETKDESRHLVVKKAIANVLEEMSNAEIPTDNDGETDFVDDLMDMDGGKDALTMYGFSSIESRLEAKRAEQEKKEKEKKKKNWLISRVSQVLSSWCILTAIAKDQKLLK
ncbi:hypothetical protein WA171_006790 [Blastocystis sp. BT1]